jgi:RNA recognition motif-containing protein
MCSKYGVIISSKAIIDQKRGECKGYGFVLYSSAEEAESAIESLNATGFHVSFAKLSNRESFSHKLQDLQDTYSTNLYISNLPVNFGEIVSFIYDSYLDSN